MTAFTGKTGDVIRIRRNHDIDEGFPWVDFNPNDMDAYADCATRVRARHSAAFAWKKGKNGEIGSTASAFRGRIAKVIKRTPCYVYAQVSK